MKINISTAHCSLDPEDIESAEDFKVSMFLINTCYCSLFNGKPCCNAFSSEVFKQCQNSCLELDHVFLDMVLMGQIMANTAMSDVSHHARTDKSRAKSNTKFYHRGIQVKHLHNITHSPSLLFPLRYAWRLSCVYMESENGSMMLFDSIILTMGYKVVFKATVRSFLTTASQLQSWSA